MAAIQEDDKFLNKGVEEAATLCPKIHFTDFDLGFTILLEEVSYTAACRLFAEPEVFRFYCEALWLNTPAACGVLEKYFDVDTPRP